MMYNKIVCDCFFMPRHVGFIDSTQERVVVLKNTQKGQGIIELSMQCGQDRRIQKVRFKTNGNPYLIAGLEWLSRQLEGCVLDAVPSIDYQLIVETLEIPTTQYPLALRMVAIYKEILVLMQKNFA